MDDNDARARLRQMFDAAVAAALPERIVADRLPPRPKGRTVVVGAGKASAAMARAFENAWDGEVSGLVVTRYGHAVPCERIEIVEAAHPVPDAAGQDAAGRILDLVSNLGPDDLVVALISGGGSSLLALPADGLSLDDKQAVSKALLRSGATIQEMNAVRKHLSKIKGGRLAAAAHPAKVTALAISDVPGDDLSVIASGPTVPDPSTFATARNILRRYGIEPPESVRRHLEAAGDETPKPNDPRLADAETILIATPMRSLEAAADAARAAGITPLILGDAIEGEAREVGVALAGIARSARDHGHPLPAPCVLLSGGETTVTVKGDGRGGRNVECLLGLTIALAGTPGIFALMADTDGVDGAEEVAGAIVTPDTLERARDLGRDPQADLDANDAHTLFKALNDQVVTGPTLTNVNDFRAVLVV